MKISLQFLKRFIALPQDHREVLFLLEDLGLEVKHWEAINNDFNFTLELLANRGDHRCYEGIARELNGRLAVGVKRLPSIATEVSLPNLFEIQAKEVLVFSLTEFKITNPLSALEDELLKGLTVSGINLLNAAVNITNLVNLELGQPMHAYDADKIKGKVILRLTAHGEKAQLLFSNEEVILPENSLVIADEEKILAVAGVMGCKGAEVDHNTRRIYLESALFDPVSVRKTSKHLGLQTLASMRYERGGDRGGIKRAIERARYLYKQVGWQFVKSEFWQSDEKQREIELPVSEVNTNLSLNLTAAQIADYLQRLDFSVLIQQDKLLVTVPWHRVWDVKIKEDLWEEIARVVGYDNIPNNPPPVELGTRLSLTELTQNTINQYLTMQGFFEVITDALYSNQQLKELASCQANNLTNHVKILNACDKGYSFLRNNTILQAVGLVAENWRMKNFRVKVFEWAKVFYPINYKDKDDPICKEEEQLWGIISGPIFPTHYQTQSFIADLGYVKGLLVGLARCLGVTWELKALTSVPDLFHPKKCLAVYQENEIIGYCGELQPRLLFDYDLVNLNPVYFELKTAFLQKREVIGYPEILSLTERDVNVALEPNTEVGRVVDNILNLFPQYPIHGVVVKDIFLKDSWRQVTYTIIYKLSAETSAEMLNQWTMEIKNKMEHLVKNSP